MVRQMRIEHVMMAGTMRENAFPVKRRRFKAPFLNQFFRTSTDNGRRVPGCVCLGRKAAPKDLSMSIIRLDYRRIVRLVLSILAGLLVIASLQRAAKADTHVIIVPANDGYGIEDCLSKQKGCGEIVASAWCEAEGYAAPLAYGRAEDITGVSASPRGAKLDPNAFIVKCAD
jgi:hypothetical protein